MVLFLLYYEAKGVLKIPSSQQTNQCMYIIEKTKAKVVQMSLHQ